MTNDHEIGDLVVMHMAGVLVHFIGQCVSTKEHPIKGTRPYDHPRFEIIGIVDPQGNSKKAPDKYRGTILKPGDYVIACRARLALKDQQTELSLRKQLLESIYNSSSRTLLRVVSRTESDCDFIIPGRDVRYSVKVRKTQIPDHIWPLLVPDKRLHARVNIDAEDDQDLVFSDWESD